MPFTERGQKDKVTTYIWIKSAPCFHQFHGTENKKQLTTNGQKDNFELKNNVDKKLQN